MKGDQLMKDSTNYLSILRDVKKHIESGKKLIDKSLIALNSSTSEKEIAQLQAKFEFASKLSNIENYTTNILNQINMIEKTLEKTA